MKNQSTFAQHVYDVVRSIPSGCVMSYKEVARRAGSPNAFRAVGTLLSKNYDEDIPCHRVIRADGKLGGYNRGAVLKRERLTAEGAINSRDS